MAVNRDEHWMRLALKEAKRALAIGELPIASVLVANDRLIGKGHSQQLRSKSITVHAEWLTLRKAKDLVWTAPRPLVLYTTLEPCVMCLGAAMLTAVDKIVFGMRAVPNGGSQFVNVIKKSGQKVPEMVGDILENEEIVIMREFLNKNPNFPRLEFVRALLAPYT